MFLYPFKPSPLFLLLISSVAISLAFFNLIIWLLGIFIFATFVPAFSKYLFLVLLHSADGFNEPPQLTVNIFQPFGEMRQYKLLLIIACGYYLVSYLFYHDFKAIAQLIGFYAVISLPAVIGLLTMSNNLVVSLKPSAQFSFIQKAGFSYFILTIVLVLSLLLVWQLIAIDTNIFFMVTFSLYSILLMFHWLGKIIYQRRRAFDYDAENSSESKAVIVATELEAKRELCLYRARREYPADNALAIVLKYIESEDDTLAAHRWFSDELLQLEHKGFAKRHSKEYYKALLLAGKTAAAEMLKSRFEDN